MARMRTEIVIATTAMVLSAITAGAVIWQAKIAADHRAAAVWPHLQAGLGRTVEPPLVQIRLHNAGIGPALIRYFSVRVDDVTIRSWDEFLAAFSEDEALRNASYTEGTVAGALPPNTMITAIATNEAQVVNLLPPSTWDRIEVAFCYCSIYDQCWLSDGPINGNHEPTPVRACPSEGRFAAPDTDQ